MRARVFVLGLAGALALSAGVADAQGNGSPGRRSPYGAPDSRTPRRGPQAVAPDQVVITGVVTALGPEPDRVTIAYGAVDALNWPAGSTPFVVADPALLNGITVGQKVKFKIESAHIYQLDRL